MAKPRTKANDAIAVKQLIDGLQEAICLISPGNDEWYYENLTEAKPRLKKLLKSAKDYFKYSDKIVD